MGEHDGGEFAFFGVGAHGGGVTLNWILASCSGARPSLRSEVIHHDDVVTATDIVANEAKRRFRYF